MIDFDSDTADETDSDKSDKGPLASRIVRELAMTGLATFFMTEDSVRKYLKDLKLPKELASLLLDGANKKKNDFYGLLGRELSRVMAKVDVAKEIGNFLSEHKVHLSATFSFEPKSKPEGKSDKVS